MPVQGTRELRLGNSIGYFSMFGPGFMSLSPEHGSDVTTASVAVGMGYFLAEHVEAGGSVGFFYIGEGFFGSGTTGSPSMKGPTFSAFLRFYSKVQNVGLFFEPTLDYQYLSLTGGSLNVLAPGADVGIEVFLADSWALRLSPTLRYYKLWASADNGASNDSHAVKFGVNWGISAYF